MKSSDDLAETEGGAGFLLEQRQEVVCPEAHPATGRGARPDRRAPDAPPVLATLLLVTVTAEPLLPFVSGHLVALALATTRHGQRSFRIR